MPPKFMVVLECDDNHAVAFEAFAPAGWAVVAFYAPQLDEVVVTCCADIIVAFAVRLLRRGCGVVWTVIAGLGWCNWLCADVAMGGNGELYIAG